MARKAPKIIKYYSKLKTIAWSHLIRGKTVLRSWGHSYIRVWCNQSINDWCSQVPLSHFEKIFYCSQRALFKVVENCVIIEEWFPPEIVQTLKGFGAYGIKIWFLKNFALSILRFMTIPIKVLHSLKCLHWWLYLYFLDLSKIEHLCHWLKVNYEIIAKDL